MCLSVQLLVRIYDHVISKKEKKTFLYFYDMWGFSVHNAENI